ncbi:MAG: hypothetical protein GF419_06400 [Ignavibacteriales bacterium]|jgi:hypothetical protein|nr:hypothetical protein [Ignavibacteriales bacterium]
MIERFDDEELERLRRLGLLDEVRYRNIKIRRRFRSLQGRGYKMRDAEYLLADEFYLSPETIHRIRYAKGVK